MARRVTRGRGVKQRIADRVSDGIDSWLTANGIDDAEYIWDDIPHTRLLRLYIISDQFKHLYHSDRQSLVWRAAEATVSPEELMHVSMIMTLTPEELGDE